MRDFFCPKAKGDEIMKKILSTILMALLFVTIVNAQWTTNAVAYPTKSDLKIKFEGTLDTLGQTYATLTSNPFSLEDYDGVTDLEYSYLVSHSGNVKLKVTLLRSDYTITAGSMLSTVLQDSIKIKTESGSYQALQGIRKSAYRLKVESLAGSRDGATFKITLKSPKRDF